MLSPTGSRGRWERVVAAIPKTAERVELLDKGGGVLAAVDIEQEAAEPAGDPSTYSPMAWLALLLKAQDAAVARHIEGTRSANESLERLARMLADRLTSLEKGYSQVLQGAFDATLMAAEAAGTQAAMEKEKEAGDDSPMDGIAKMLLGKMGVPDGAPKAKPKKLDKGGSASQPVVQKGTGEA